MIYYLAEHPRSGKALFSRPQDARDWCDRQHRYHHPETGEIRWISGGEHGWEAQRGPTGARINGGTVRHLVLDKHVSDSSLWAEIR